MANGARARTHRWYDEEGTLAFEHRKKPDGSWSYRHPVNGRKCPEHSNAQPKGGWCFRKPAIAQELLWNMKDLCDALDDGRDVGWFAGEKDANAGTEARLASVCTSVHQGESAGTYPEQAALFAGTESDVCIYVDDDKAGWRNGVDRYEALIAVGLSPDAVTLRLPAEGSNDVSDHLADAQARSDGWREVTVDELRALLPAEEEVEESDDGADILAEVHAALRKIGSKQAAKGSQDWTCPLPSHDDKHPSFGVIVGANGSLAFNCQGSTCMPKAGTAAHKKWYRTILKTLGLDSKQAGGRRGAAEKETVSQVLIRMTLNNYRLGIDTEGKPFAVRNDGGNIARFFDKGTGEFSHNLAREFYRATGKAPGSSAMAEALSVLHGFALELDPEDIQIRVGLVGGGNDVSKAIAIDIGDGAERSIVVGPEGWDIVDSGPVLFRRTKATLPFPEPIRGTDITELGSLLNLRKDDFDLVVAYLIAAFIPNIQHPIMALTGAQGTGKSDATRMLSMLIDPSGVPLRKKPKDEQAWSVTAYASWVICLENMSWIPEWFSDDLCSAVTGAGIIERQLHTNDDIRIRAIRRVILINGIDPGGIRLDLADRMFSIRLQEIKERLHESEVEAKFAEMAPGLFGALLDLLVEVLRVQLSGANVVPYDGRMGDFALVARAVDIVRGTDAFGRFKVLRESGMKSITEDDPLTAIVIKFLSTQTKQTWSGTPSELFAVLENGMDPGGKPTGWPKTPRSLSQHLTRLEPGWRSIGINLERSRGEKRIIRLSRIPVDKSK